MFKSYNGVFIIGSVVSSTFYTLFLNFLGNTERNVCFRSSWTQRWCITHQIRSELHHVSRKLDFTLETFWHNPFKCYQCYCKTFFRYFCL